MDAIARLEHWRKSLGKNYTWSIGGPSKGWRDTRWRVTLYEWRSPRWNNEASQGGDTLDQATDAAIQLWSERHPQKSPAP